MNSNDSTSNNSFCPICGYDHDVLVISLENGGQIVTKPFYKDRETTVSINDGNKVVKMRTKRMDLVDIFWPTTEQEEER
ncbi:MAG TPA: hypothetical protein VIP70_13280 [Nitrososphaeraceae archaeon]